MRSSLCEQNVTTERSEFQQSYVAENRSQDSLKNSPPPSPLGDSLVQRAT